MVIIDQEEHELEKLVHKIRGRILSQGEVIYFHALNREIYIELIRATRRTFVGIAISGLDDHRFAKHSIEDHLLRASEILGIISITESTDPKEKWRSLGRDQQPEIFLKEIIEQS